MFKKKEKKKKEKKKEDKEEKEKEKEEEKEEWEKKKREIEELTVDDFDLLKVIGKGIGGKVIHVRRKDVIKNNDENNENKEKDNESNEGQYAMKVTDYPLSLKDPGQFWGKKWAVLELRHPFLVSYHHCFHTVNKMYFIMDYVRGGELFYYLSKERQFTEDVARFYSAEIFCGIEYLHENGVVFRNLKPENVLLDKEGHCRLTDFGPVLEAEDQTLGANVPEYLAPEILQGFPYEKSADWWSFGVMLYEMLTGLPPFYSQNVNVMCKKIMSGKIKFPDIIGKEAKDLLEQLLIKDPNERLTDPNIIIDHFFFVKIRDWDKLAAREYEPPLVPLTVRDDTEIDPIFTTESILEGVDPKYHFLFAPDYVGPDWVPPEIRDPFGLWENE